MMNASLTTPLIILIVVLALIELVLKGFALWKSSKNNDKAWFVAVLLINTAGILPGIYLLMNRKNA